MATAVAAPMKQRSAREDKDASRSSGRKKRKEHHISSRHSEEKKQKRNKKDKDKERKGTGRLKVQSMSELAELVKTGQVQVPKSLSHYLSDKVQLLDQVFTILSPDDVKDMIPDSLKSMKVKRVRQLCYQYLETLSDQQLMEAIEESTLSTPADPTSRLQGEEGEEGGEEDGGEEGEEGGGEEGEEGGGEEGGGGGEEPSGLSLEQKDRLEAMEGDDNGGSDGGGGDGGDGSGGGDKGGDSKGKMEFGVSDDGIVITVSDVSESSHGDGDDGSKESAASGCGLESDVHMDEKHSEPFPSTATPTSVTPTSVDFAAPCSGRRELTDSASEAERDPVCSVSGRSQTRQDDISDHTSEQAPAADEAEETPPPSGDGCVNIESSHLLEMELRRRALEAELLRANADHKRPEGRVGVASSASCGHGLGTEPEMSEICAVESEDVVYLHPEGNGEEGEGVWPGEQGGCGVSEPEPMDGCGQLEAGPDMEESLEERLRQRALESMWSKRSTTT